MIIFFGMRQIKDIQLSKFILNCVNILSAKFDFDKVKQD